MPIERQALGQGGQKHAGAAHQISVFLYLLCAVPSIQPSVPRGLRHCLRRQFTSHLSSITDQDENFNSTLWPAFIVGAEAETLDEQAWALDRFYRLTAVFPWGSLQTAIDMLQLIWKSKQQSTSPISWLLIVKSSEMNLLLV